MHEFKALRDLASEALGEIVEGVFGDERVGGVEV
jgi:hypothetical protein